MCHQLGPQEDHCSPRSFHDILWCCHLLLFLLNCVLQPAIEPELFMDVFMDIAFSSHLRRRGVQHNPLYVETANCVVGIFGTYPFEILFITRSSWTRNLIFCELPYTNLDHYIIVSMENYALDFLHIAQSTLNKFLSSWHKI